MVDALDQAVRRQGRPFLGICVGMQLMAEAGREHGRHEGLGWIEGEVVPLAPRPVKIPHMGWNELHRTPEHPLLAGIRPEAGGYFGPTYPLRPRADEDLLARAAYSGPRVSALAPPTMAGLRLPS